MSEATGAGLALPFPEILRAVRRASARSSVVVHEELRQGLTGLASVAAIAPFVGLLGNVFGIVSSFRGLGTERSTAMTSTFGYLAIALWPTALGLLVGLTAHWGYKYLTGRLAALDREMENASLELVNRLSLYRERLKTGPAVECINDVPMFGAMSPAELRQDRKDRSISTAMTGVLLGAAWCAQFVHYRWLDHYTQGFAQWAASVDVLFALGVACFLGHAVWNRFLHRRTGGLAVLGSATCFCWCAAELFLGAHLL